MSEVDEKLRNMMLAHLDGIYLFSARENCDDLVTQLINILLATQPQEPVNRKLLVDALETAEACINAHSARLCEALDEEGNAEPQFACEATYACDKIQQALSSIEGER